MVLTSSHSIRQRTGGTATQAIEPVSERHQAAREGFFAGATIDVPATRAALNKLTAPVLLYAGDLDPMVTPAAVREAAPLFNDAIVVVQPAPRTSHGSTARQPSPSASARSSAGHLHRRAVLRADRAEHEVVDDVAPPEQVYLP
jgi:pimeloyl-ACP methyl ester carboxylesterase